MRDLNRIGVLGGTFDPIHYGHLDAAEAARHALALDTVLLVPSRVPPHRTAAPRVSEFYRFAMVALAVADHERFLTSDIELMSSSPSFTSITLERLTRSGTAPSNLFFIAGADAFAEIASWHDYPAVLERSHFIVVSRPGCSALAMRERLPELSSRMREPTHAADPGADNAPAIWLVDVHTRDISSSALRRQLSSGRLADGLVPATVSAYITQHGLYAETAGGLHGKE